MSEVNADSSKDQKGTEYVAQRRMAGLLQRSRTDQGFKLRRRQKECSLK